MTDRSTCPAPLGKRRWIHVALLVGLLHMPALSQTGGEQPSGSEQTRVLCDFESSTPPKLFEYTAGTPRILTEGALEGDRSLEIVFDPKARYHPAYMNSYRLPRDWSAYDALVLEVMNPNDEPIEGYLLVADRAWEEKGRTYWNRHNSTRTFPPGRTSWVIPIRGLYRGEAGSRNNDIGRNIDPDQIVRVDFGFGTRGQSGRVVIDQLRLIKAEVPENVWAFDFGPPDQAVMLGWRAVNQRTAYSAEQGFGWGPQGGHPWDGAARDTTFGTMLLRDFCEAGGYRFRVDVPPGRYRVLVFYENSGYWGGEQAQQNWRKISVGKNVVWQQERPDGSAHALYRFENIEPIGADIWDTYMAAELAQPAEFQVTVAGPEGLVLRFEADRPFGSKVAALVVYPATDARAAEWVSRQQAQLATEFRNQAVCLDPPAGQFSAPEVWQSTGLVAWPVRIEDDVTPNSLPEHLPASPEQLKLRRLAVGGEFEPFCIAVRPLRNLGKCQLELEPPTGPGRVSADVSVVWYNTSRGFGNIAYHIRPHTLRRQDSVVLPKDVTRMIVVTALVRRGTPAGTYRGRLAIRSPEGDPIVQVSLELDVHAVAMPRKTDFLMGFFGLMPPKLIPEEQRWNVLERTLRMLREHGMNAVSGGPSWRLTGWHNGEPVIDFGEVDRFLALLRKYGFSKPVNGYGGLRFVGLHQGYQKGAAAQQVAQQSGLPYEEAFRRAWRAVDSHAREAGWPTIFYAMCDETRVRSTAERELEFMKLMAEVTRTMPQTVRASGAYSVTFDQRPTDRDDMLWWHQRFFEVLDISNLNNHDQSVMDEAERLGKEIHIYNQGRTRYSFGLYQWSEYRKGVKARWQWHLNILHGYQFFDLDGREPDTAMICYGRNSLYPTIHFVRCREGAEDFYLYQLLHDRIAQQRAAGSDTPALREAVRLLEGTTARVKLNERQEPEWFDADRFKAQVVQALEQLQQP